MLAAPDIEELRALAERDATRLYALVDAARDPRIAPAVGAEGEQSRCLFDGKLHPALAAAAPYLVALAPGSAFTPLLMLAGWGRAWGVIVASAWPLDELRRHFRRFLRVTDASGRALMFRYYDPRVLRSYLPTCTPRELEIMFGPVDSFFVEDAAGRVERWRNFGGVLIRGEATTPDAGPRVK